MGFFVVRRLALFVPTVVLVSLVVFLLVRLIPGNPAYVLLGPNATPRQVDLITHSLALDQPLWTQYATWLERLLHGDFGDSYINDFPVAQLILQKLPATDELAVGALIISVVVSFPLGILSALYNRQWIDCAASLYNALAMGVPVFWLAILLAMGLIAVLGEGTLNAGVAVTVVSVPSFARLARASALAEKQRDYVEASRALGASHRWILFRAILPNSVGPLVVQAGVTATAAILLEAALSFLGLGTRPPTPSWGQMLNTSRGYLYQAWWYGLFPGLALSLVVLSLNHLADAAQRVASAGWRSLV